jgi:hypothetical protein
MLALDHVLEAFEPAGPQLCEELLERREPFRADEIEPPLPVLADCDEAGLPQNLEVLGDRLLSDVEVLGDLADRARPVPDEQKHLPPARLGQRAKDGVGTHRTSILKSPLVKVSACII